MRIAYLDCFCGISGDMTVGALIDAGAPFDEIAAVIAGLGLAGCTVSAEKVNKKGVAATHFNVHLDENVEQPHRHLRHVVEIIESGKLPKPVRAGAIDTFTRLAGAEAAVHGVAIEKVHFHEVGAIDAIVDIVAAHTALHLLGIEAVHCSPLHVGAGTVKCAHGVLPVPAPATARLLLGKPTYGGEVPFELVTPTGAALVDTWARGFGGAPAMRAEAIGYGCGTRDLEDRPNVLRVLIGEAGAASGVTEHITVIEANIDDMTGELAAPLVDALLAGGARDAFTEPVLGKKGRPALRVTALCDEGRAETLAEVFFRNSTTFGVRMRTESRIVLERAHRAVETPWGAVQVKLGYYHGAVTTAAPEYESCRAIADAAGVPVRVVYEAAQAAAWKGEFADA